MTDTCTYLNKELSIGLCRYSLYNNFKNKDYLEMVNSAISLSKTVRLDLINNKIDLTVGKDLFVSLLTAIEISAKRCK